MRALAGPRVLLRRLREIMAEPISAQDRLDKIVAQIAVEHGRRSLLGLCAARRRRARALRHRRPEARGRPPGAAAGSARALSALIAADARPLNLPKAQSHPAFAYLPETGEEIYNVLPRRAGAARRADARRAHRAEPRQPHLSRRGGRGARDHRDGTGRDDRRRRARRPSPAGHLELDVAGRSRSIGSAFSEGIGLGHVVLHEPRVVVTNLHRRGCREGAPAARAGDRPPAPLGRRHAVAPTTSRSTASTATCSRPIACSPTTAAGCGALEEAIDNGLTAEAAVEKVQSDTRARLLRQTDPVSPRAAAAISTISPTGCCAS